MGRGLGWGWGWGRGWGWDMVERLCDERWGGQSSAEVSRGSVSRSYICRQRWNHFQLHRTACAASPMCEGCIANIISVRTAHRRWNTVYDAETAKP
jgi:hypothetical protein